MSPIDVARRRRRAPERPAEPAGAVHDAEPRTSLKKRVLKLVVTVVVTAAIVLLALAIIYRLIFRPRVMYWGATSEEVDAALPGDEVLAGADLVATRAISISAPPERVWPWLVQLGYGRGGFYSYDALESVAGLDIHSADEIIPEWQQLGVGDLVHLAPELPLTVARLEPERTLVLRGSAPAEMEMPFDFTWTFALREEPGGGTRLLARERYVYHQPVAAQLVEAVELVSFAMTRKMLQGIRERAEGARI